jgi:uncharacterized membrane protein
MDPTQGAHIPIYAFVMPVFSFVFWLVLIVSIIILVVNSQRSTRSLQNIEMLLKEINKDKDSNHT